MPSYDKVHDETKPAGTRARSLGDDDIREKDYAIRERFGTDHKAVADETGVTDVGYHKWCTFIEAADIGAGAAGLPILGAQTSNGKPELCYTDEDNNDIIITRDGYIDLANARVKNNVYIKGRNAADNGDVDLIKVDANGVPVVPDGIETVSNAAPTSDKDISNKKYVDDSVYTLGVLLGSLDQTKLENTVYQAATDGFVMAYTASNVNTGLMTGKTDANTPPTTVVQQVKDSPTSAIQHSIIFPVKKNHYWKVETTTWVATVLFIPLGA